VRKLKVIIAGGRDIAADEVSIASVVRSSGFAIGEVVSGGASGVDALGEAWATENGIPLKVFKADWDTHGRAAGPIRNREMACYGEALILIWNGESRGSASMLGEARSRDLPVYQFMVVPCRRS
jgi:hypothetical protein